MRRYLGVILAAIAALIVGALPASAEDAPNVPSVVPQAVVTPQIDAATMEAEMLRLTNEYRSVGRYCPTNHPPTQYAWFPAVPPVRSDARLVQAARAHSLDMGVRGYYAHNTPDNVTPGTRVTNAGFQWTYMAENIFAYYPTAAEIVAGWINHMGHCQNIMSPTATFMGNGYAYYDNPLLGTANYKHYYTQDFAAPQPGMVFAPDAPTITSVAAGNGTATVNFRAGWNGGSAITNYVYSVDNGASWFGRSPASAASPLVIGGLRNGVAYQVRIRATNGTFFSLGASPASNMIAVTPKSPLSTPAAPTINVMTPGDGQAWVGFAPGSDGGSPITNFQYSVDGGAKWQAFNPVDKVSPANIPGLQNGTTYQVKLRAVNAVGVGSASASVPVTPVAQVASVFVPLAEPVRVINTAAEAGGTPLASGSTRTFSVANAITPTGAVSSGVPAGAVAIAYNLTVQAGPGAGHLRVMPGDAASSPASAINFPANQVISNGSVVKVDSQRRIRIYNAAGAAKNVTVEVLGYFMPTAQAPAGGKFTPTTPTRVYDSERDLGSDRQPGGLIGAGETRNVDVMHDIADGSRAVPDGSSALAYNITVVGPQAAGGLQVVPGDKSAAGLASINWSAANDRIANGLVLRIAKDGTFRVHNNSKVPVRFLIDVVGYYRSDSGVQFYAIEPARSYDSRAALPAPGKLPTGDSRTGAPTRTVSVADARDSKGNVAAPSVVPAGARAIAYNVTVTNTVGQGHFRVFPAGQALPGASVINWPSAGYTRANATVVGISADRKVTIFNSSLPTDGIIDTLGYYK